MNAKKSKRLRKMAEKEFSENFRKPKVSRLGRAQNELNNKYRNLKKQYLSGDLADA